MGKDTHTPEHGGTRRAERAARGRTAMVDGRQIPVTLPRARFTVDPDGHLTVTVDGRPWEPPADDPTKPTLGPVRLGRGDVPWAGQQVANELGTPVRVETDGGGRSRTDIVLPDSYQATAPGRPQAPGDAGPGPYAPGELVSISLVVGQTHADKHGHVRYRLPAALGDRPVLVHSEASGTTRPLNQSPVPEPSTAMVEASARSSSMGRNHDARRYKPDSGLTPRPAGPAPDPTRRDTPDAGLGAL
ncbi:hypothetical protein ACIGB8_27130 [Promicromonospora sukumoe]|uniref:hypothetical protein n=1 Tax=Promicromonospora sukumoe TaxID=88382 RepID=UPI0037C96C5E